MQAQQHAIVGAAERQGFTRLPNWSAGVSRFMETPVPGDSLSTASDGQNPCPVAMNDTSRQKTYGVLDISRNGSLVLMQSLPPFETRKDLTLARNVGCPTLRARIRAVFTTGMDIDLLVVPIGTVEDRLGEDCVLGITQEIEDKK